MLKEHAERGIRGTVCIAARPCKLVLKGYIMENALEILQVVQHVVHCMCALLSAFACAGGKFIMQCADVPALERCCTCKING